MVAMTTAVHHLTADAVLQLESTQLRRQVEAAGLAVNGK